MKEVKQKLIGFLDNKEITKKVYGNAINIIKALPVKLHIYTTNYGALICSWDNYSYLLEVTEKYFGYMQEDFGYAVVEKYEINKNNIAALKEGARITLIEAI